MALLLLKPLVISEDIIENVEEVDKVTFNGEEHTGLELWNSNSSKCMLSLFRPLLIVFLPGQPIPDPDLYSRFHFQEAVNMPITATRRLLDVSRAVVDGH